MESKWSSKWGSKYIFDMKKYITSTTFNDIKDIKYNIQYRNNIIFFFFNIGFLATINQHTLLNVVFSKKKIYINDLYWNGKCDEIDGIKCYFSNKSLLVRQLNNKKKIDKNTLYCMYDMDSKLDLEEYEKIKQLRVNRYLFRYNINNVLDKLKIMFKKMWKLNKKTTYIINSTIGYLFNQKYIGIHIRLGDKIGKFDKDTAETTYPELDKIPKIIKLIKKKDNSINTIFIATDDYEAVEKLNQYKELNNMRIITFAKKRQGYNQKDFNLKYSTKESYDSNIDFLVDLSALFNATYYIGTLSSNIMRTVLLNDKIKLDNVYNLESYDTEIMTKFRNQNIPLEYQELQLASYN